MKNKILTNKTITEDYCSSASKRTLASLFSKLPIFKLGRVGGLKIINKDLILSK